MALTAWPWTAGRRPTGELALPLPGLGGISERRQLRQPLSLGAPVRAVPFTFLLGYHGWSEPLEVVSPYLRGTRLLFPTGDSTGLHRLVTALACEISL